MQLSPGSQATWQRVQAGPDSSVSQASAWQWQDCDSCMRWQQQDFNNCTRWQWQVWPQILNNNGFCAEGPRRLTCHIVREGPAEKAPFQVYGTKAGDSLMAGSRHHCGTLLTSYRRRV